MKQKLSPSWFVDQGSHEAFMLVVDAAEKLKTLKDKKDIVFIDKDNEHLDIGELKVEVNGMESRVMIGSAIIAGCTHDEDGHIYMDVKETKELLRSFQVYERKSINWLDEEFE